MTVNTVSPAIISRAEFNLNAGQTKTPQLVRMDFTNLVTNGTFDTDTDWTKNTGWTIGSGVASKGTADNTTIYQTTPTTGGRRYSTSLDVTISSGGSGVRFSIDGVLSGFADSGSLSFAFTAAGDNTILYMNGGSFNGGSIDNVTLYEADPSDDAPWLRLPYGYSVGRTGMIVRDGVILHPSDYSEVKDSGQTWIKPLVSPGVSTEFSIWGSAS